MDMLIAEDLLLLILDDHTGRLPMFFAHAQPVLGGALLAQLALDGVVRHEERQGLLHRPRVHPVPGATSTSTDPLLADAWRTVAEKPRTATQLVDRLGRGLRPRLQERLVQRGVLEQRDGKVLGLFPTTVWPSADLAHERRVREHLQGVLVHGLTPDPRTVALVGLLHAAGQVGRVGAGTIGARELKRRATAISGTHWVAAAVTQAIRAAQNTS